MFLKSGITKVFLFLFLFGISPGLAVQQVAADEPEIDSQRTKLSLYLERQMRKEANDRFEQKSRDFTNRVKQLRCTGAAGAVAKDMAAQWGAGLEAECTHEAVFAQLKLGTIDGSFLNNSDVIIGFRREGLRHSLVGQPAEFPMYLIRIEGNPAFRRVAFGEGGTVQKMDDDIDDRFLISTDLGRYDVKDKDGKFHHGYYLSLELGQQLKLGKSVMIHGKAMLGILGAGGAGYLAELEAGARLFLYQDNLFLEAKIQADSIYAPFLDNRLRELNVFNNTILSTINLGLQK